MYACLEPGEPVIELKVTTVPWILTHPGPKSADAISYCRRGLNSHQLPRVAVWVPVLGELP